MGRFGELVRRFRREKSITQGELANRIDVSLSTIQKVEASDEPQMQAPNYRALAEAMGLTTDELDRRWQAETVTVEVPLKVYDELVARAKAAKMPLEKWLAMMTKPVAEVHRGKISTREAIPPKKGNGRR